jgi:cation/acetate symporter
MVGSGTLIALVFGIPFAVAEVLVGSAMLAYLLLGGLLSSTWMQVIKAVLLLIGVTLLAGLVLSRFGFSLPALYRAARDLEPSRHLLAPGQLTASPLDALSLGLALMFGLLGLPHILARFYSVADARTARLSVLWATGLIGSFYLVIPIVGFGAAVLLSAPGTGGSPPTLGSAVIGGFDAGGNLAAPLLAQVLGGAPLLGFVAAVAFTTVLAVVSGLTLASSSTWSHDIYVGVIKQGRATEEEQVKGAKLATLAFGAVAVAIGIAYQGQNVAFLVGLSFAVAASSNFPALLMAITWSRFTTGGAVWSILVGAFSSVGLIVLSETIWVNVFHFAAPVFPLRNPALVSMPLAFAVGIVASLLTPEPEALRTFETEKVRILLGVGTE